MYVRKNRAKIRLKPYLCSITKYTYFLVFLLPLSGVTGVLITFAASSLLKGIAFDG